MVTVLETPAFARRADKLFAAEERDEVIVFLAANPEAGDEIPGTGGVRKLRFAAKGRGKSGGARVIYYYFDDQNPLYAIFVYGKGEQADLTPDQTKAVANFASGIKAAAKVRRKG
ncbi:MAG: type II toxin-antitoxin system RelE/ParE family toxin [Alphaproteobacteria bacterium]|nr:type II toxin-antitoxin system RelE/ParE family toxin [Alphaproteobacteria bacterium]